MSQKDIDNFIRIIIKRGMRIDTEGKGTITHKHNEVDPAAPLPPLKLDLCTSQLRPTGRMESADIKKIGELLWEYAKDNKISAPAIAGVPRVGEAIAEAFQQAAKRDGMQLPLISLSKEALPDGTRRIGPVLDTSAHPPGQQILPLDDLVHRGFSKLETIARLRESGYIVKDFLVFLDYGRGAKEILAKESVALHSVITLKQILSLAEREDLIRAQDLSVIREYLMHG
jgi:orotate phosphoribosyltransferase